MNERRGVKRAVSLGLAEGYHLESGAFDFLCLVAEKEDPKRLIEVAIDELNAKNQKLPFISKAILEAAADAAFSVGKEEKVSGDIFHEQLLQKRGKAEEDFAVSMKEMAADVKVIEDPTKRLCSTGSIGEFSEYFRDRLRRTRTLLQQRIDSRDGTSIKDVFRAAAHSTTKVYCMVSEKRDSRAGTLLKIEDVKSSATAIVQRSGPPELQEKLRLLLLDQVVCLSLFKSRGGFLIVKDLSYPDIPLRTPHKAKEHVCAALISDLHIGSKEFMQAEFNRFLLWLNGKFGSRRLRRLAGLVKYVIIAGDVVDGIGVYPNQIDELAVKSLSEQYRLAAEFLEQIPDYIELIIVPGNHDASRKALPQPALPKEYLKILEESRSVLSLGNPANVRIHGVDFLIYHGRSLDDVLATVPGLSFSSPEKAMRLLLKGRHLAPTYGKRTRIAPEKRDFLVINRVPDVFLAGHVHVMKYGTYRGTLMINSGAWQKQTNYQRSLGLEPTPGIIPVLDLRTLSVFPVDFNT
jgi:DNA polymerase II small subunit